MDYSGQVRRIDFNLRSRYPWIKTVIHKVSDNAYVITLFEYEGKFESLVKEFDHSIKFITTPVKLSLTIPDKFDKVLPSIDDDAIPSQFEGIPLTILHLANLIECRNSNVSVVKIDDRTSRDSITISILDKLDEGVASKICQQLADMKLGLPVKLVHENAPKQISSPNNDVFFIPSASSTRSLELPFLERDESLWFDNIDSIYHGDFRKKDLFFIEPNKTSCYVDFTSFRNINLRNHLLLYDIVYISLPLQERTEEFLKDQKLTREDLLELASSGRIKIINTQPEWRLDLSLQKAISAANMNSIISRRAISVLCAIDVVQMSRQYVFSDIEIRKFVKPLSAVISVAYSIPSEIAASFLLWPTMAFRSSFEALTLGGTKAISRYGVNNLIALMLPSSDSSRRKALEFEYLVHSEPIHIANALEATYFPFFGDGNYTNFPFTFQMGNLLRFFQLYNDAGVMDNQDEHSYNERSNPSLELINIFQTNDYLPIGEFEAAVASTLYRKELRSLFSELNHLSREEQKTLISKYNDLVKVAMKGKNRITAALDLGEDAIGLAVPFVSTGKKVFKSVYKLTEDKYPIVRDFSELVKEHTLRGGVEKKRVSILARINRVARLNIF